MAATSRLSYYTISRSNYRINLGVSRKFYNFISKFLMINDGNAGNAGQINPPATTQISAKEFGSKFKSKRGRYLGRPDVGFLSSNDQRLSSAELLFGGSPFDW